MLNRSAGPSRDRKTAACGFSFFESSADRVSQWVERRHYRAYDPGDGQLSYLRALTFGTQALERLLTASVLRAPLNVRPILGIKPHTSTKGMGYMAWGYLWRFRATGDSRLAEKAAHCLKWLLDHRSRPDADLCWGNDFTFTTRAGRIPRGEPTVVWSGLIGQAFADAYEVLGESQYLDAADSICRWILNLPREKSTRGACISYHALGQSSIHNANMLGGALLARVGTLTGRRAAVELARESMLYSCSRQNCDGGWFYGEEDKYHWIDSFHTGYNLDSLKRYGDCTHDDSFAANLLRGYSYFKSHFIESDGRIRYMHNRLMPIDIQCAAQAIDTLSFFAASDSEALNVASRVARWTIEHMQSSEGFFYYRDVGWTKIRTPMLHWGQGTMFKALAHLLATSGAGGELSPGPAPLLL